MVLGTKDNTFGMQTSILFSVTKSDVSSCMACLYGI
jgi:hypothetical protein